MEEIFGQNDIDRAENEFDGENACHRELLLHLTQKNSTIKLKKQFHINQFCRSDLSCHVSNQIRVADLVKLQEIDRHHI
jgi:hypothetical protein